MPRKDYDSLVQYFIDHKEELKPFEIINPQVNNKCPYTISRISDSRYQLDVDNEDGYGIGLFVDVYPLDGVGNTVEEYSKVKKISSKFASMCFLSTRQSVKRENTKSTLKYIIKFPAFIVAKILGKNFFMKKLYGIESNKRGFRISTFNTLTVITLMDIFFDVHRVADSQVTIFNHHLFGNLPIFPDRCRPFCPHPLMTIWI